MRDPSKLGPSSGIRSSFPLRRFKGQGLGRAYGRYLVWWFDGTKKCRANLRQLDEAKQKWSAANGKSAGDTPFAAQEFNARSAHHRAQGTSRMRKNSPVTLTSNSLSMASDSAVKD